MASTGREGLLAVIASIRTMGSLPTAWLDLSAYDAGVLVTHPAIDFPRTKRDLLGPNASIMLSSTPVTVVLRPFLPPQLRLRRQGMAINPMLAPENKSNSSVADTNSTAPPHTILLNDMKEPVLGVSS